ncbi:Na+/H+ antiporter NhaC family protein [Aureibacter tunicatorum]|uniref:Na+/H+ antiporter NhaC n=1 Tax=Aureibacter tunicatorum TaxID=866807 RepID=A0AAE3XRQ2_9BACT|nr:Na+/H+ antiporter NhaC family protein [Aureibacter tunicatorum]MDR6240720.1 Na+/H+ antiporter NhaC [Aureibacter tunicatorum]BDD06947.1 sodium:proton antiporter [Aureibacter tunicatorum]
MSQSPKANFKALLPLLVFIILYLGGSLLNADFYSIPAIVCFLVAAAVAFWQSGFMPLGERFEAYAKGAGGKDIMLMTLIFILAGAFGKIAKASGAIDATVNMGLSILPGNLLVAGVFIIACFISVSIGTSVGTIAALAPLAADIASKSTIEAPLVLSAIIGGAMFGDNLSMISDTTIAASRTQGAKMRDKFKMNFKIVLPAAVATIVLYSVFQHGDTYLQVPESVDYVKVFPYLAILGLALSGLNVFAVLSLGIVIASVVGLLTGDLTIVTILQAANTGISGMGELIIICMIIGGMVELIRINGGIQYLLDFTVKRLNSKKSAEFGIAALVSLVNICTANNTIAIVIAGPLAKEIAQKFEISPARSASLLDTFSCFTQGAIPYGAQILTAVSLVGIAGVGPFDIMKSLYYPYLMVIASICYIVFVTDKKTVATA